jgi:hypothetical protein
MNNQNPESGQLPQHRMTELMEELRKLRDDNSRLKGTIDQIYQRQMSPPPTQQEPEPFEQPVAQAIEKKVRAIIEPETQRLKQTIGYVMDENDYLKFVQKWGHDTAEKYRDKIEKVRDEANRGGRYVTREEAYQRVYFDENTRKPQPKPEPAQQQLDPYTGQWAQTAQPTQTPPVQAAPVQPQQTPPPAQQQAAPDLDLPPAGPMAPSVQQTPAGRPAIGLESDDTGMSAWENRYGDIPL